MILSAPETSASEQGQPLRRAPRLPPATPLGARLPGLPLLLALAYVPAGVAGAAAQRLDVTAQSVLALTHADPIPGGESLTELRIVQPWVMARGTAGPAWLRVTLDGEGATIANGELALGAFGEGYVDRRHPHTYAHELMAGASLSRFTVAAGKGFVPFGSDDPMSRPPLRYPVNHHLAQLLERAVLLGSGVVGPVELEASIFNGDEPENPSQWPNWERFGDSWSLRATVRPSVPLELQGSYAFVTSPEHRPGGGSDQDKWSVSARWDTRGHGGGWYGLAEWAYSVETIGDFAYHSFLAEAERPLGTIRAYARLESTERPEEVRVSAFRTQRPHTDNTIVGTTRWTMATVGAGRRFPLGAAGLSVEPVAELWLGAVEEISGAVFDPESFYGTTTLWSVTVAVRVAWGAAAGHRMGRYGVLSGSHSTPSH